MIPKSGLRSSKRTHHGGGLAYNAAFHPLDMYLRPRLTTRKLRDPKNHQSATQRDASLQQTDDGEQCHKDPKASSHNKRSPILQSRHSKRCQASPKPNYNTSFHPLDVILRPRNAAKKLKSLDVASSGKGPIRKDNSASALRPHSEHSFPSVG